MNNIIKVYNFFYLILLNKIMNDKANDFNYYQSIYVGRDGLYLFTIFEHVMHT